VHGWIEEKFMVEKKLRDFPSPPVDGKNLLVLYMERTILLLYFNL
jgi:hypothetical protein